jgi:hypothetical protein
LTHHPSVELGKQAISLFKDNVELLGNRTLIPQLITYSIPAGAIEMMSVRGGNALGITGDGHLISMSLGIRMAE